MRIESLISEQALTQFDELEKKVSSSVQEFDKLILKTAELNKQLGSATGFKEIVASSKELEASEKALSEAHKKMASEIERLEKKYNDLQKKIEETDAKQRKRNETTNAETESAKRAADATNKTIESLEFQGKAYDDLIRQSVKNALAQKNLKDERKKLDDQFKAGNIGLDQYETKLIEIKAAEQALKTSNADLNKILSIMEKQAQASSGSLKQMEAQLELMLVTYDRASDEIKQSPIGKELLADIQRLTKAVSEGEQSTGRFRRQVGNYRNGASSLVVLKQALTDVTKKMDEFGKEGQQDEKIMESLNREYQLLTTIVNSQVAGFANARQELRANTQALQALEAAGLKGSAAYKVLFNQTAELKDETSDLQAALKNAAPDDVAFNAAADAARGLIGVYGLAKSVTAAFGLENEALQETMVKLQAAETALQSIEAIRLVFKKENSVRQAINIGLNKIEILQTNLQTASQSKNTVVKYAAVLAQKALNAVMAANPILLVIGALVLLTAAIVAFTSRTEQARVSFEGLNNSINKSNEILDTSLEKIKNNSEVAIASLEAQGATQAQITNARLGFLNSELIEAKKVEDSWYATAAAARASLKAHTEGRKKLTDEEKQGAEGVLSTFNNVQSKIRDTRKAIQLEQINDAKRRREAGIQASQDELELAKINFQDQANIQNELASNEANNYEKRIEALREFGRLQELIANTDARKSRTQEGLTPAQLRIIEANRSQAVIQARSETAKRILELEKQFAEREQRARFEITKQTLEATAGSLDIIANNEKKSHEERSAALFQAFEIRRGILSAEYVETIRLGNLTATERLKIEQKYQQDVVALTVQFGEQQLALNQTNYDKLREQAAKEQQKRIDDITTNANKELTALNAQRLNGTISAARYEQDKANIEYRARTDSLRAEINNSFAKVLTTKQGTEERAQAEKELAEKTKQYSDEVLAHEQENKQKIVDLTKQVAQASIDAVLSIATGEYERQKNAIEDQIEALEKKKLKDIEVAQSTIANEQDRAAAIAVINAKAQAQKEQFERRQKQIDQDRARFEKAAAIARIIVNTASAIVKALDLGPPQGAIFAALYGALGAAQLARVVATPIPKYYLGTEDHPGGPAEVHSDEMIVTPDGELRYTGRVAKQTVDLPEHTQVIPRISEKITKEKEVIHEPSTKIIKKFSKETSKIIERHSPEIRIEKTTSKVVEKPSAQKIIEKIVSPATTKIINNSIVNNQKIPMPSLVDHGKYYKEMTSTLGNKIDKVSRTIKNKKEQHISASHRGIVTMQKFGNDWIVYVEDIRNFKP